MRLSCTRTYLESLKNEPLLQQSNLTSLFQNIAKIEKNINQLESQSNKIALAYIKTPLPELKSPTPSIYDFRSKAESSERGDRRSSAGMSTSRKSCCSYLEIRSKRMEERTNSVSTLSRRRTGSRTSKKRGARSNDSKSTQATARSLFGYSRGTSPHG